MAATWQVARSLDTLLAQLNAAYPLRSRASDGGIGDAAHATRDSDHNPWFVLGGQALVTARDFTHDPAGGLDCARLALALRTSRDGRIKYVIWDRQIMSGAAGPSPWVWRAYSGSNPHTKHLHLSVVADARCQSVTPWLIAAAPTPAPREDDDMTPEQARMLQVVYDQITGNNFKGWPTWAGGTEEALSLVDFGRRANVETRELHRNLNNAVHPKLDAATVAATQARDHAYTARTEIAELQADVRAALAATPAIPTTAAGAVDLDALAERIVEHLVDRLR
jgi:hypothetical protein